jgi:hypothetical protein
VNDTHICIHKSIVHVMETTIHTLKGNTFWIISCHTGILALIIVINCNEQSEPMDSVSQVAWIVIALCSKLLCTGLATISCYLEESLLVFRNDNKWYLAMCIKGKALFRIQ